MLFPLFPMPNSRIRQLHPLAIAVLIASMLLGTTVPRVLGFAPSPRGRLSSPDNSGFATPNTGSGFGHQRGSVLFSAPNDTDTEKEDNLRLLESIRSMRVKELKAELAERNISSADAFEKEELVQRLYKAKQQTANTPVPSATPASSPGVLRTNLFFTGVDTDRSMAGIASDTSERVTIRADAGSDPYPTVVLDVHDGNRGFPLKLLVDTACSGLVLRPSVVRRHSASLKSYSTPVTMTGGAGAAASTGLTQVESCSFGGAPQQRLGPLPAAVQDIGALPLELDGILGLSVLGRYACVEFDLDKGCLALYENEFRPPLDGGDGDGEVVVAEAELSPTKLGIWTVDMSVSVEGTISKPVKMLVDTGAMCTFLTHRGLEQTGISKSFVKDLTRPTGAMGSDNMAMSLTKRIELDADAPIGFGKRSNAPLPGLSLPGSLPIDIGNIGILDDQLSTDNVVGILGMDVLSKASRIRMTVRGPIPRLTLYQKKQRFEADRGNASAESPKQSTVDVASPTVESTATDAVPREKESDDGDDPIRASSPEPTTAPSPAESVSSETEAELPPPKKKKKKKKRRYD